MAPPLPPSPLELDGLSLSALYTSLCVSPRQLEGTPYPIRVHKHAIIQGVSRHDRLTLNYVACETTYPGLVPVLK